MKKLGKRVWSTFLNRRTFSIVLAHRALPRTFSPMKQRCRVVGNGVATGPYELLGRGRPPLSKGTGSFFFCISQSTTPRFVWNSANRNLFQSSLPMRNRTGFFLFFFVRRSLYLPRFHGWHSQWCPITLKPGAVEVVEGPSNHRASCWSTANI